jgi:hypothetical protein
MGNYAIHLSSALRILGFILVILFAPLMGVTELQSAESDVQWLTVNKDYSSQRYVDLDQITPANVAGLKEVCEINLNVPAWFNSGMLMVGRTILRPRAQQ